MDIFEEVVAKVISYTPMTEREVCKELFQEYGVALSTRRLRNFINSINKRFINKEIDYLIVGGPFGVMKTQDEEQIKKYNNHKRSHAFSELKMAYDCDKQLWMNKNITFQEYVQMLEENENEI